MNQDTGNNPGAAEPESKPVKAPKLSLAAKLRNYFLAGMILTAPVVITIYVSWQFFDYVDQNFKALIPPQYNPETYLPFSLPGLGLLVMFVLITAIGALAAGFIGRALVRAGERILARMPIVRNIYSALKQIFQTVFADKSKAFREVVLIEYPRKGSWALGFATGTTTGEVQHVIDDEVVNVFLPTTPNPTSGYLLFLPRRDVTFLSMNIEDGIKMVISGGVVTPPDRRPEAEQRTPRIRCAPETPTALPGDGTHG